MSEKLSKIFTEISKNMFNSFCGMCYPNLRELEVGLSEENQQIVTFEKLKPEER